MDNDLIPTLMEIGKIVEQVGQNLYFPQPFKEDAAEEVQEVQDSIDALNASVKSLEALLTIMKFRCDYV